MRIPLSRRQPAICTLKYHQEFKFSMVMWGVSYWPALEYICIFFSENKLNLHAVYNSFFSFSLLFFPPFRKHKESCCHIFFNVQPAIPFVTSTSLHPLELATASENKAWIGNPDLLLLKHFQSVHLLSFIHDKPYQLQSMRSVGSQVRLQGTGYCV